jgi:hypothetical protein
MWQRIRLALLVGMVGTVACVGYFISTANVRPQPGSYREAVEHVLDKARISYRGVEVTDGCAPTYELCRTYAGSVRVLTERATFAGQIDCRRRWTICTLTIPAAGLHSVALPNVVDPLPRTLNEVWERIEDWFHQVTFSANDSAHTPSQIGYNVAGYRNG